MFDYNLLESFLAKHRIQLIKYKNIVKELNNGISIRRTAKLCSVAPSLVQRVKKQMISSIK